jgi:hypothetical protein
LAADLTFLPVVPADLDELAANMRPADRDEITASNGADIRRTLGFSLLLSVNAFAVRSEEGLLCVFGTAAHSLLDDTGAIWMLGTPIVDKHPRTLSRVTRRYVAEMLRIFPILANWVDARNAASIKLLRWCGFTIGEPEPYGVRGLPFHRFEKRA